MSTTKTVQDIILLLAEQDITLIEKLFNIGIKAEMSLDDAFIISVRVLSDDLATFFIKNGANINSLNKNGQTALYVALNIERYVKSQNITRMLINAGADLSILYSENRTILNLAAEFGLDEIVELLITKKVDLNIPDNENRTPIRVASSLNHDKIVKLLLDAEANPNIVGNDGRTALMRTVESNSLSCFKLLIKSDRVDYNIKTHDGKTALILATQRQLPEYVEKLADKTDLQLCDNSNRSALDYAIQFTNSKIIKILIKAESKLNIPVGTTLKTVFSGCNNPDKLVQLVTKQNTKPVATDNTKFVDKNGKEYPKLENVINVRLTAVCKISEKEVFPIIKDIVCENAEYEIWCDKHKRWMGRYIISEPFIYEMASTKINYHVLTYTSEDASFIKLLSITMSDGSVINKSDIYL